MLYKTYIKIRSCYAILTFVILTRILIGFAFIPSGLKKLLGERFTSLGKDTQIGFFFEALYQSGIYYNFIGLGQVVCAILLMSQRFATLGAIIFFFITSNIWVITISLKFSGTWVVTTLLLVANVLLLIWDYDKIRFIFLREPINFAPSNQPLIFPGRIWELTGLLLVAISFFGAALYEFDLASPILVLTWLFSTFFMIIIAQMLYFPKDMHKQDAEVNKLNNQVLVKYFEQEWGSVSYQ